MKNELEELSYLWEGKEDWVLWASPHQGMDLKIVFKDEKPSLQEIMSVRKLLKEYRLLPIQQAKEQLEQSKELSIGIKPLLEARQFIGQARKVDVTVVATDASYMSYMPAILVNKDYEILLIEDDELAEQVNEKMLQAGVRIIGP